MTAENLESIVNSPEATNAELAKSDDVTEYVAERTEQEEDARPPEDETDKLARDVREKYPELKEQKKASRYERLKRARDQYKAEADELRSRLGESSEPRAYSETDSDTGVNPNANEVQLERSLEAAKHLHGDAFHNAYQAFVDHVARTGDQAAYQRVMQSADQGAELVQWWNEQGNPSPSPEAVEAAMQQGRQQQEIQQQLAARDEQIREQTAFNIRAETFARECSDYHEVLQSVQGMDEGISPVTVELIRRSEVGPEIAYLLARDFYDLNSMGLLDQAIAIANDPIAQARMVGALEQVVYASRKKNGGMSPTVRATKAPPPLSAPRDLHSLAKSDSADDYIRVRRSAS